MLSIASLKTIAELKIQFAEILGDIGFLPSGLRRKTISKFQVFKMIYILIYNGTLTGS